MNIVGFEGLERKMKGIDRHVRKMLVRHIRFWDDRVAIKIGNATSRLFYTLVAAYRSKINDLTMAEDNALTKAAEDVFTKAGRRHVVEAITKKITAVQMAHETVVPKSVQRVLDEKSLTGQTVLETWVELRRQRYMAEAGEEAAVRAWYRAFSEVLEETPEGISKYWRRAFEQASRLALRYETDDFCGKITEQAWYNEGYYWHHGPEIIDILLFREDFLGLRTASGL